MKIPALLFLACFALPKFATSQSKITLTPDMLINVTTKGDANLLINEQHLISSPPSPTVPSHLTPTGNFSGGANRMYYPLQIVIDLKVAHRLTDLYAFDTHNEDSLKIFTGTPSNWQHRYTLYLGSYLNWMKVPLDTTTRFIMLEFPSAAANISEIALFGTPLFNTPPALPPSTHKPPLMEDLIGVNAVHNQPIDKLKCVGSVREYHSWQWDEGNTDTSYSGYPNNQFAFSPSWVSGDSWGWNFDQTYANFKSAGLELSPCLQKSVPYMQTSTSNIEHKPISPNDNPNDPFSYVEHARYMYQFAARYGSSPVPSNKLMLRSTNQPKSGMGLIKYVENWNEEDKWWRGRDAYFSPFEMAAMCSADYDGHEGALGNGYGAKAADPNIKFVMGGLAILGLEYVKSMKLWSDFNRSSGFPADVINFHHYSNISGGQGGGLKSAISPEDDSLKYKLKEIARYRDKELPGKEIWLSEFGYDTNPNSPQGVQNIGQNNTYEVQAQWLVRSYLEIAAAGIDRGHIYFFSDINSSNPSKFNSSGLVNEQRDNYQPKTSWYYIYAMKKALTGYRFHSEIPSGNPAVNIYKFYNENTSTSILAVWCNTSIDKKIANFPISLNGAIGATLLQLIDGDTLTSETPLPISNQSSVNVNISERPIFIRTANVNSTNCIEINSHDTITVYLDNTGKASITPVDIDYDSKTYCGPLSLSLSLNTFDCSQLSTGYYVEIVSDSTWRLSTIDDRTTHMTFPWTGVKNQLPPASSFSLPAVVGQPKRYHTIDSVPGSYVIKCDENVRFYRKTFFLPDLGSTDFFAEMTVDDDMEIYLNGHLIAREESHNNSSSILPPHRLESDSPQTPSFGEQFDFVESNLKEYFKPGQNEIILAIRNRRSTDNGGFSFRMAIGNPSSKGNRTLLTATDSITGASENAATFVYVKDIIPPTFALKSTPNSYFNQNGYAPVSIEALCDTVFDNCQVVNINLFPTQIPFSRYRDTSLIEIVSDSTWKKSTHTDIENIFTFPWAGANDLPDSTTYSIPVTTGQPFSYNRIHQITGTEIIGTTSYVTFFKKSFTLNLDTIERFWIDLAVDDDAEIYINNHRIAREGSFAYRNPLPPTHCLYFDQQSIINGHNDGDMFDYVIPNIPTSLLNTKGYNEIILAIRNGRKNNIGGFSFKLSIPTSDQNRYPIKIVAMDKSKNITTAYTTTGLLDTIPPTIVASSPLLTPDSAGILHLTPQMFDNGSYDNTSIESLSISPTTVSCANAQNATLTAIDYFGNISTLTIPLSVNTSLCPSGSQKSSSVNRPNSEEDKESWKVTAYPLPAYDELTVQLENVLRGENISIEVWDLSGKLIIQENTKTYSSTSTKQLDLSNLASGQYFLKVKHSQGNKTMKFTVN